MPASYTGPAKLQDKRCVHIITRAVVQHLALQQHLAKNSSPNPTQVCARSRARFGKGSFPNSGHQPAATEFVGKAL